MKTIFLFLFLMLPIQSDAGYDDGHYPVEIGMSRSLVLSLGLPFASLEDLPSWYRVGDYIVRFNRFGRVVDIDYGTKHPKYFRHYGLRKKFHYPKKILPHYSEKSYGHVHHGKSKPAYPVYPKNVYPSGKKNGSLPVKEKNSGLRLVQHK